jgi:two-component system nitrogen regulation sensor histidine kinase NtrY
MVDEFSAFARMPQPVIKPEDLSQVLREALVLQRDAHPEIEYRIELPEAAPVVACDRRLLGQALTNLLQNAADAVTMRAQGESHAESHGEGHRDNQAEAQGEAPRTPGETVGHITVRIEPGEDMVSIAVEDDGIGLPQGDERERLAEPYVTHKAKGTGLGLAIVKKIMEDHGGRLGLEDRPREPEAGGDAAGARAVLTLPWRPAQDRPLAGDNDRPDGSMRRAHGA